MKSFIQHVALRESTDTLDESGIRTAGATALTLRINNLKNQTIQLKYQSTDSIEQQLENVFKKLDLLAQQNYTLGLLTTQINLMR